MLDIPERDHVKLDLVDEKLQDDSDLELSATEPLEEPPSGTGSPVSDGQHEAAPQASPKLFQRPASTMTLLREVLQAGPAGELRQAEEHISFGPAGQAPQCAVGLLPGQEEVTPPPTAKSRLASVTPDL